MNIQELIDRANIIGIEIEKIPVTTQGEIVCIHYNDENDIYYIPDSIKNLTLSNSRLTPIFSSMHYVKNIKFIGGNGLETFNNAFMGCYCDFLDLTELNTSHVLQMIDTFSKCSIDTVKFGGLFSTENVVDMRGMFRDSKILNLDISSFNTSNVLWMEEMFSRAQIDRLNLGEIDTSNVKSMSCMFISAVIAEGIDFTKQDTHSVVTFERMFNIASSNKINVEVDMSSAKTAQRMFMLCSSDDLRIKVNNGNPDINTTNFLREARVKFKYIDYGKLVMPTIK